MGQKNSSEIHAKEYTLIRDAFQKDQIELRDFITYGDGVGAMGLTETTHYSASDFSEEDVARMVLSKTGPRKSVYYIKGTAYEMGYLLGRLNSEDIEAVCTTYIRHIPSQFFSPTFDLAMRTAPVLYNVMYEFLLEMFVQSLMEGAVQHFRKAVSVGDIPVRFVEEMRGIIAGAKNPQITEDRLIAANYGIDYIYMQIMSGQLLRKVKRAWELLPHTEKFEDHFLTTPDMCNAFMVSGAATLTGEDSYFMRDFQFMNGNVYHRACTIIIRQPVDPAFQLTASVGMPGMIGSVVCLNDDGVVMGANLVRSTAINRDRLGLGCLMTIRACVEQSKSVDDVEHTLKQIHIGIPWIYYAQDGSGNMRVFETIAESCGSADIMTAHVWIKNPELMALLPPSSELQRWAELEDHSPSVWPRTAVPPLHSDAVFHQWSTPLLTHFKLPELASEERWRTGGYFYNSWVEEQAAVITLMNYYFPPWRHVGEGILVVTNNFLNPLLRLTQMSTMANMTERMSVGNQWRYDDMTAQLQAEYGRLTYDTCKSILTFLSPWKHPDYPQNMELNNLSSEYAFLDVIQGRHHDRQKNPVSTLHAGSLTIVDTRTCWLENKNGYWGTDWYGIHLKNYASMSVRTGK